MKRLIPTIMPACCLVLLFSACSEKSSYTQLIPGDASSVVAVNLQSLTEKAGISSGTPAYESLQKAFSSGKDNPPERSAGFTGQIRHRLQQGHLYLYQFHIDEYRSRSPAQQCIRLDCYPD